MSEHGKITEGGEEYTSLSMNDSSKKSMKYGVSNSEKIKFDKERVDAVIVSLAEAAGTYIAQQPHELHSDLNRRFRDVMKEAVSKWCD